MNCNAKYCYVPEGQSQSIPLSCKTSITSLSKSEAWCMLFKVLEAFFKHGKLDKPQIPLKPLSVMIQMTKIIVPESERN